MPEDAPPGRYNRLQQCHNYNLPADSDFQSSALSAQLLPFGVETTDKTLPAPVHAGRPLARRGVHSCTELYHLQIL